MANKDIRELAKSSNVPLWLIGKKLGYKADATFSRKLREEFDSTTKQKVIEIIKALSQDNNRN